jgi:hypothetical protein
MTDGNSPVARGYPGTVDALDIERLRTLVLDMGRLIRSLDESGEHSEFWTQDGDYIIDGRFPK